MHTYKAFVLLLLTYATCVTLACLLWPRPYLLTACYAVISLILLARWHSRPDLIFYTVAFFVGPLGELFAIASGAWTYTRPFYIIPLWLPFLWGIAALFIKKLSDTLTGGAWPR
jgi:uncharacterized membrane protein YoaT (DUF817 family)